MSINKGSRNGPLMQMIEQGRNPKYSEFVEKAYRPKQPKVGFKLPELPVSNTWAKMKEKK